ncbi:POP1 ribonuclease P/MRP subunit [Arctopsyche grandis]|uniref:POP1 ribonuclease P/MRP subunit n=1 Tax=Arctopsyche grandis TaxID=121162 RepID=UPI00406D65B9
MQFDKSLCKDEDGDYGKEKHREQLPDEVHLTKFAAARARELSALTQCLSQPAKTKLAFQSLPVHMRRRVMSHDSRRLPRRLRPGASAADSPVNSRRARRRPHRLLAHFARRQRQHTWLETHIWHAKRFHMTKRWGYSLPEAPCDKAFRACYRAGSAHCLLQDISYLGCIQLSGPVEKLSEGFKTITSPKCGLGIAAKCYVNGEREGNAFVFDINKYPYECLGRVSFIWNNRNISKAFVWIFAHPSFYQDLVDVIVKCFTLTKTDTTLTNLNHYCNKNAIQMVELNKSLNRLRLIGPLSHAILTEVLRPVMLSKDIKGQLVSQSDTNWFKEKLCDDKIREYHSIQTNFWQKMKNLRSPAEMQSKIVLGLNVDDPRVNFPRKRTKALPNYGDAPSLLDLINIPAGLNFSLLWSEEIRKTVFDKKITNLEMNNMRENSNLVPGEMNDALRNVSGIPVLLVQQPGSKNSNFKKLGYNSGWDLILPAGYGMPFWLSLILRGARTGGLRETSKLLFESGNFEFQPDTLPGRNEELRIEAILKEKYFRLPPNKRVNFTKLSINSPFLCHWNTLINNWNNDETNKDDFFVLREKKLLEELQVMITAGKFNKDFSWNLKCLIPIKVLTQAKGKITDFALICLPSDGDKPTMSSSHLVEPLKKDKNEAIRRDIRNKHRKILKSLRRKSVRRRKKILEQSKKFISVPKQNNSSLIQNYLSRMRELWLSSNLDNVRNQCSRETIGYVVKGDFSFTEAKSAGVGYVALKSLEILLKKRTSNKTLVLVRNTLSRQYRYASLDIICDVLT